MTKTLNFSDKVNVYEFEKENVKIIKKGVIETKTWDGLSFENKFFQDLIILFITGKINEGNEMLNKLNIFQKYTLKSKVDNLLERFLIANQNNKNYLSLLKGGGGQNRNLLVNRQNYQMIMNIKTGLDNFLERQKNMSSIKLSF